MTNPHIKNVEFILSQANQPFEGKVDTRIGTLEFNNQYPSNIDTLNTLVAFHRDAENEFAAQSFMNKLYMLNQ